MRRVVQYILFTYVISWSLWGIQILGQEGLLPEWFQLFGMFGLFGPLFAFLIMIKIEKLNYKETFKKLFIKTPKWIVLFVLLSPMILSGLAYIVYFFTETGTPEPLGVSIISFIPTALMILFVGGPVEEFGWRGYLLPKLRNQYNPVITILIVGLLHGIWHVPLHFLNGTVQQAIPIYEFLIITVAITVSYVFVYEYTKSLIPMILLHWFANLSSAIFPYFYSIQGRYALLVFYVMLDIVLIILIQKRHKIIEKVHI